VGRRLRSWWLKIKQHPFVTAAIIVALVAVGIFIFAVYAFGWDWTGLNGYTQVTTEHTISGPSAGTVVRTEVYQSGKAFWDWLQLLIIPAVLTFGVWWLTRLQQQRDQRLEDQRAQTELEIATDNQREAALKEYYEKMSELLLHENLRGSAEDAEVRKIARVWTLTVLPRLDKERKRGLLQFLYESGLIEKGKRIVDLSGADLSDADLFVINLSGADLSRANLRKANLFQANLSGANLTLTVLTAANLFKADLSGANLEKAFLDDGTDLSFADLSGSNLQGTFLKGTNLQGTNATPDQLKKAIFYESVTMPDGSTHA